MSKHYPWCWLLLGLFIALPGLLPAQTYGNEWIDYNQQYLRLKVAENGMYKVTYQQLQQAGFPVSQINPKNLQLFHRGQEQAILIEGEQDETLNTEDYLLFWGRKNDGTLDKALYQTPELQPHNYHNLYSDTTAYYLTFSNTGSTGKRMQQAGGTNTGNLAPEPFFWDEKLMVFAESFSGGMVFGFPGGSLDTYNSYGDEGEGWFGPVIANGASVNYTFAGLTHLYTAGPVPELKVQLVGRNNLERSIPVKAGPSTAQLTTLATASFSSYRLFNIDTSLPWSAIGGDQTIINVSAPSGQRISVAYLRLRVPRLWRMDGQAEQVFRLPASTSARYVAIENVAAEVMLYDVSDPHHPKKIAYTREGSTIKALLPASGALEQRIWLSSTERAATLSGLVTFRQLPSHGVPYILISNKRLMQAAGGFSDPVQAYADYRSSAAGGGNETLLVEMQELFDQFSYGEYTSLAIRKFIEYAAQDKLPEHIFLIGKSLTFDYKYKRTANWTSPYHDLVPTYGWPGADIPFVAQLNGSGYAPAIAIGRLAARTPEEVAAYLNKVIEDETVTPKGLWLKRLVHLSGGNSAAQAQQLRGYLANYERIARGPFLGAKVATISKTEDVVVQEIDISKEVNAGVRLITFFGHSGAFSTDIEIGYASDPRAGYHNKGYYPRFLINGCAAGTIFHNVTTFGEDWMVAPDKGAVNFIAHTYNGYTTLLNQYSTAFYRVAVTEEAYTGASIGIIQREAVRRFMSIGTITPLQISQSQQMVLQGDPALVLFKIEESDFETNDSQVSIEAVNNQPLNTSADSIGLEVIVRNFGKAVNDSLTIQLEYWLDSGSPEVLTTLKTAPVYHQDTISLRLGTDQLQGPGLSNFKITLNVASEIPESDYTNNTALLEVLIPAGGTLNLLPQNYAVINTAQQQLLAQAANILAPRRAYTLQLDTAYSLSSNAMQSTTVESRALASWQVTLPEVQLKPADTIVYYWGSSLTRPGELEDASVTKSSFTYIKNGGEGWAQAHEGQFSENNNTSLEVGSGRQWNFVTRERSLEVTTFGPNAPGQLYQEVVLKIDGVQFIYNQAYRFCANNTINALQFDKNHLGIPKAKIQNVLSTASCGREPQVVNSFVATDVIRGDNDTYNLERYLREMPEGDWVLLFSIGLNNYTQWPASVKQQVYSLGLSAGAIDQLTNGEPMIILGRKGGAAGTAKVVLANKGEGSLPPTEQIIHFTGTVSGVPGIGYIESPLIGPAESWQDVAVQVASQTSDHWELQVIGVNTQEQQTTLLTLNQSGTVALQANAADYPYLLLRMQVLDTARLTPPQLRFWRVGYETLPEGVLLANDTVPAQIIADEGQTLRPGFKFVNISRKTYAADSLQVQASLLNANKGSVEQEQFKIKSPAPGDTVKFGLQYNTENKPGENHLSLKVNPVPGSEVSLANNVLDVPAFLRVRADSLHPFIDVAFDGSYITNGEIVSPDPLITVVLRDENQYKLKQDTTGIHLFLKRQCESCKAERVNLSDPSVRFYPATAREDCRIEFSPGPLEDGFYTLQVQAEDAAGNKAGTRPYSISFEVVSESSLTHFYPYPNPFSTSTRFVFTLTGYEVPADLKIQIMTVSGKVIREIMKEELGPLRIGHNITQYAWDGTDEWGDRLANGVYLYRVVLGGPAANEWKHRATKGDQAFKQDFGKLYILR